MSLKAAVFFLVALILAQDVLGAHVDNEEMARGFRDKVKEALHKLERKVNGLVAKALKSLTHLHLTPELKKFIDQINDVIGKAMAQIDQLQNQANKVGVDVSSCIVENKNLIKNIGISVLKDLQGCGTKKIKESISIIDSASKKVKNALEKVTTIVKKFSACGSGITSVPCYAKLSGEITKATVELPASITKEVTQATVLVTTLKKDLQKCAMKTLALATFKVPEILKTVTKCVNGKL